MTTTQPVKTRFSWEAFRDKVVYGIIATVVSAILLSHMIRNKPAETAPITDNRIQNFFNGLPSDNNHKTKPDQKLVPGLDKIDKPVDTTANIEPSQKIELKKQPGVQLEYIDPNKPVITTPDAPVLELITENAQQSGSNGLHDYYGLDLNLSGDASSYIIGSPAITRYFKLKGGKHKGIFVITNTAQVYYTDATVAYGQSCNFHKLPGGYGLGWSNEHPPCGKFFKLFGKFNVYPCASNIMYTIGAGDREQADEFKFPVNQ